MIKPSQEKLERLKLRAKAFEFASQPIMITDAENRIVEVNLAFAAMTGYSAADIEGENPRILSSGRTSQDTYGEMWKALSESGKWEGEIWDRHRSGEIYPKWLTISVVRGSSGETEYYVASFIDISERKAVAEKLAFLAHHDPLTGLANRLSLDAHLQSSLASAQRDGRQVALFLIDIDNFKQVNDTLGHNVGDKLLIKIARRLKENVRASDIIARLGGDEFVIILRDIENALSISAIASKLQRNLSGAYDLASHTLYATPSIGIALFPGDGDNAETLMKNADSAMYHAKAKGRNAFQFFESSMNAAAQERLRLEVALRGALQEASLHSAPQFQLYYQPQIDIATGRITGLEALARWRNPELGFVPPSAFIPIAEETGLIQPLGDWVFWEACRRLREFKDAGINNVRIAVNLSTQQLRHENLPIVVRGALASFDLFPDDLELEITETTAMQNPVATIRILEQLDDIGIVLAIDDFGTGHSSLAYLKHLPVHRLKLDRSFVKDVDTDRDDAAICTATIVLGHNLGLTMVAEGVETEGQRDSLKSLGCDQLQGFLYCKPLPAEEIIPFVLDWNGSALPI